MASSGGPGDGDPAKEGAAGVQAELAREAREQRHRVGNQHDTGRGDDVEQVMVRGSQHVDRRGSGVEPGCRS